MALEAWIAFLYIKSLHKERMLHGDVCDNNRGPGALLAAWYLRKCPVVETFEFLWEVGGGGGL